MKSKHSTRGNKRNTKKWSGGDGSTTGRSDYINYIMLAITIVVSIVVISYIVPELGCDLSECISVHDLYDSDLIVTRAKNIKYNVKIYVKDQYTNDVSETVSQDVDVNLPVLASKRDTVIQLNSDVEVYRAKPTHVYHDTDIEYKTIPEKKAASRALDAGYAVVTSV